MKRPTAKPYPVSFGGEEHALLFNYKAQWAFEEKFDRPFLSVLAPVLQAIIGRVRPNGKLNAGALAEEFGTDLAITVVREIKFRDVCGLVWAGLQHESPAPTMDQVGEMLESEQPALVLMKVTNAYMKQEPREQDLPAPVPANARTAEAENPTHETQQIPG